MIQMKNQIHIYKKLLVLLFKKKNNWSYKKNDKVYIIKPMNVGYVVYTPNRITNSVHTPCIWVDKKFLKDIIMNSTELEKFKENEAYPNIYEIWDARDGIINLYKFTGEIDIESKMPYIDSYISYKSHTFANYKKYRSYPSPDSKWTKRLANTDEIAWLEHCITANKYIPYEDIFKTPDKEVYNEHIAKAIGTCELLTDFCGFCKGDRAYIVDLSYEDYYTVYVPNRQSTSDLKPYVVFPTHYVTNIQFYADKEQPKVTENKKGSYFTGLDADEQMIIGKYTSNIDYIAIHVFNEDAPIISIKDLTNLSNKLTDIHKRWLDIYDYTGVIIPEYLINDAILYEELSPEKVYAIYPAEDFDDATPEYHYKGMIVSDDNCDIIPDKENTEYLYKEIQDERIKFCVNNQIYLSDEEYDYWKDEKISPYNNTLQVGCWYKADKRYFKAEQSQYNKDDLVDYIDESEEDFYDIYVEDLAKPLKLVSDENIIKWLNYCKVEDYYISFEVYQKRDSFEITKPESEINHNTPVGILPIGTIVEMTEQGIAEWGLQSDGDIGTVTDVITDKKEDFPYSVKWDNGHINRYRQGDIKEVKQINTKIDMTNWWHGLSPNGGDYVVCIRGGQTITENYVYKTRHNSLDLGGFITNNNGKKCGFADGKTGNNYTNFRLATLSEAQAYKAAGCPVDIRQINVAATRVQEQQHPIVPEIAVKTIIPKKPTFTFSRKKSSWQF